MIVTIKLFGEHLTCTEDDRFSSILTTRKLIGQHLACIADDRFSSMLETIELIEIHLACKHLAFTANYYWDLVLLGLSFYC